MPCYHPLRAFRSPGLNPETGRFRVTFKPQRGYVDLEFKVPCGQCIGCRLERSRQWALRCMHEADLHSSNCFLTLTYSDEHVPLYNSLCLRHFQLFMKRLRKRFGTGIRFLHCGEYGETTLRPHYHALLFGFDFPDKEFYLTQRSGHRLYTSKILDDLWGLGICWIGSVSFESAAYVARYVLKKITGFDAEQHYEVIDPATGEVVGRRVPEYATMSRRRGIGGDWFEKFSADVFPSDFVVRDGVQMRPPKAYDKLLERVDPDLMRRVRAARVVEARRYEADNTKDRLAVREEVKEAQVLSLKRKL